MHKASGLTPNTTGTRREAHGCNPSMKEVGEVDQKSNIILGYTVNLRPAWATRDCQKGSEKKKKKEGEGRGGKRGEEGRNEQSKHANERQSGNERFSR